MSTGTSEKDVSSFLSVVNDWNDSKEWARLIPELSCDDASTTPASSSFCQKNETKKGATEKKDLIKDGYTLINKDSIPMLNDNQLVQKISTGISNLHKTYKLPATFILLFDEAWQLAASGSQILQRTTHSNNIFNFDVLAWYIDPSEGTAGFSPHRDRQPTNEQVASSFHNDGQAKYVTLWMALSDATPENSCIYVIPKGSDPGYLKGDDEDENESESRTGKAKEENNDKAHPQVQQDPLSRCLQNKESYQNIRALPRQAGESIAFTHRIIHWGSRGNSNCTQPRIAISFVTSDPSFEKPYLKHYKKYWKQDSSSIDANTYTLPPFHIRMLLVCAQLLIYYQRFNLSKETIRACWDYCREHKEELEETYWKKVSFEFVNAMKEEHDSRAFSNSNGCKKEGVDSLNSGEGGDRKRDCDSGNENDDGEDEDDEDDEEALLEAMLENADDVEDDFDEMDDHDDDDDDDFEGEDRFREMNDDDDFEDDEDESQSFSLFASSDNGEPTSKKRKKDH